MGGTKQAIRKWVHAYQHQPFLRQALDAVESGYQVLRAARREETRTAQQGAWPARLVPLPSPKHYSRIERRYIRSVMRRQVTSFSDGEELMHFESDLCQQFRSPHAIAVSSGTAALHSIFLALGIGPGDEVIVPAFAYVSCALAVTYTGARVRFADVDLESWNIDPERVRAVVSKRTKAILAVHSAGVPCELNALLAIAKDHNIPLIEDAAQAHGAQYEGRPVGSLGHAGALSFQSAKTLTTGEGGAVLCADEEFASRVRLAMNLGEGLRGGAPSSNVTNYVEGEALSYEGSGLNYRLGALACALGRGQLKRLPALSRKRRRLAVDLGKRLADLTGCVPQRVPAMAVSSPSSFFFRLPQNVDQDQLHRALAAERVDVRLPYAQPLSDMAIFGDSGDFPIASELCRSTLGFKVDPAYGQRELRALALAFRRNVKALRTTG